MSRSYKKHRIFKASGSTAKVRHFHKSAASRAVRKCSGLIGGRSGYKKVYSTYNIFDYKLVGMSDSEFYHKWECGKLPGWQKKYRSREEALTAYKKAFRK